MPKIDFTPDPVQPGTIPQASGNAPQIDFTPDPTYPTHDQYGLPIGWKGSLENLGAGFVNPFSHLINLAPQAVTGLAHAMGAPQSFKLAQIPDIPHDPQSYMYDLGNLASFFAPFGVASKALEGGTAAVRALPGLTREISPLMQRVGQIGKSSAAGGLTAYGTAGGSNRNRTVSSIGGTLGGGIGESAGQLLGGTLSHLKNTGAYDKLMTLYKNHNPFDVEGNAASSMLNDIGEAYANARNKAIPHYQNLFNGLANQGKFMQPSDFKSYEAVMGNLPYQDSILLSSPQDLVSPDLDAIDSQDAHFYKSALASKADKYKNSDPRLSAIYGKAAQGLGMDLNSFLQKNGGLDAYQQANAIFKKNVAPFHNNPTFMSHIKPVLDQNKEVTNGVTNLNHIGIDQGARTSQIASKFIPNAKEKSTGQLSQLQTLLGNDAALARLHARNNLVAPFVKYDPDMGTNALHVHGFLNREAQLSPEQRNFLFSPSEQKPFKALHAVRPQGGLPQKLAVKGADIGIPTYFGHMIHPGAGTLMGMATGAAGLLPKLRGGLAKFLTPNTVSQLSDYILKPSAIGQTGRGALASIPASMGATGFNVGV